MHACAGQAHTLAGLPSVDTLWFCRPAPEHIPDVARESSCFKQTKQGSQQKEWGCASPPGHEERARVCETGGDKKPQGCQGRAGRGSRHGKSWWAGLGAPGTGSRCPAPVPCPWPQSPSAPPGPSGTRRVHALQAVEQVEGPTAGDSNGWVGEGWGGWVPQWAHGTHWPSAPDPASTAVPGKPSPLVRTRVSTRGPDMFHHVRREQAPDQPPTEEQRGPQHLGNPVP